MKQLFVAILAAGLATFAVSIVRAEEDPLLQATLRTKYGGKKDVETKRVKLDEVEKGVWRLCIPKADLVGKDIDCIDVLGGTAIAKKGEDGYFIGSNSDMGTFRLNNGNYINRRNMMTMFGMKTPRATFVGIVKGLPYEYSTVVETRAPSARCERGPLID